MLNCFLWGVIDSKSCKSSNIRECVLNILPLPLQEKDDLLSRFVKLSTQGDSRFDDRALRDIMINFILAGRDSTASVLSWFLYMLYRHPQVTAKVRDELSALENRCSNPGIYLLART